MPEVFTEPVADPLGDLVGRYARTHGPFQPAEVAARLGLGVAVVTATLQRLTGTGRLVTGEFRPGGSGQEWCDAEVLRSIRRRSLAKLRQEVEPVPIGTLARFTPSWQARRRPAARRRRRPRGRRAAGRRAGAGQRAGVARAAGPGARLLPRDARRADQRRRGAVGRRRRAARRRRLDQPRPGRPRRRCCCPSRWRCPRRAAPILDQLAGGQALFFRGLSDLVGATDDTALADLVWDLVWAGALTNDTLAPLRTRLGGGGTHRSTPAAPRARLDRGAVRPHPAGPPGDADPHRSAHRGRPLVPAARPGGQRHPADHRAGRGAARAARRAHPRRGDGRAGGRRLLRGLPGAARVRGERPGPARLLRRDPRRRPVRHARVGRPAAQLRRHPTGCPAAPSSWPRPTRPTSTAPRCRGRSGRPPPTPDAVDLGEGTGRAQGATGHRAGRKAGALVVLVDGELVLYVERGGKTLLSWTEDEHVAQGGGDGAVRRRVGRGARAAWWCRRPTAPRCTSPRRCRPRCRPPGSPPPRGACACAADRRRPAHGAASQSSR